MLQIIISGELSQRQACILPIEMFISEQRLKKLQFSIYMNTEMRYSTKCGGPDSNRRIPTETDLESVAFNLARQPPP